MNTIEDLKTAVINGKRKDVKVIVPELLEAGISPRSLLEDALIPAMPPSAAPRSYSSQTALTP